MISRLIGLMRTVAKRVSSDRLVIGAAFLTVMLAAVLLSSGPIYADAVTLSALQKDLADAGATDSGIAVETRLYPRNVSPVTDVVESRLNRALAPLGAQVLTHIEAGSFQLARSFDSNSVDLISFQYFEGVESRATVIAGRWPEHRDGVYETAVSRPAADTLGIDVGDVLEVVNRRDDTIRLQVEVVGVYEANDPDDAFWFGDDLVASGSIVASSFRTVGPFVVPLRTALEDLTPLRATTSWRVLPDFASLTLADVGRLRSSMASLGGDLDRDLLTALDGDLDGTSEFTVDSGLARLLSELEISLDVTRANVIALIAQMAIMAGYALALTAGLLVGTRGSETYLARARGASPGQLLITAMVEGLVLTIPAVVAAPYLASALLTILNHVGPLAAIDLTITPRPTPLSFMVASLSALVAIVTLAWPALQSARWSLGRSRDRRQRAVAVTQRLGVDVALLVLAGAAFWQLGELAERLGAGARDRAGVDPLLVVAPGLGLLAGSVLALRVIPLLARLGERIAASGRRALGALAAWQVARRPTRYARSGLLLVMAVAIGLFAASYSTTWVESQHDQAAHSVGADIRLTPDIALAGSLPDLILAPSHETIDGVVASMPVDRRLVSLVASDTPVEVILLDARRAGEIVELRSDLGPEFDGLMSAMGEARPSLATVQMPGQPEALALEFEVSEIPPDEGEPRAKGPIDSSVSVVVQDGNGVLHRVPLRPLRVDLGKRRMVSSLTVPLPNGAKGTPVYPLSVVSIEMEMLIPGANRKLDVKLHGILAREDRIWTRLEMPTGWSDWRLTQSTVIGALIRPSISPGEPSDETLNMLMETGAAFPPNRVFFSLRPAGSETPDAYPVVMTPGLLSSLSVEEGARVSLPPLRTRRARAVVSGTVASFPTVEGREAIVADLPTIQALSYEAGFGLGRTSEYWITVGGEADAISAALRSAPWSSPSVQTADAVLDSLISDPVALGTIGALAIGFVAATAFAVVGFVVSGAVSARERAVEFALIRAAGLSKRQLSLWLFLEQAVLVISGLALGTLAGLLLTSTTLPRIALTQDGSPASPGVIVTYPWETIAILEVAVVLLLALIVGSASLLIRQGAIGSMLRLGEDR